MKLSCLMYQSELRHLDHDPNTGQNSDPVWILIRTHMNYVEVKIVWQISYPLRIVGAQVIINSQKWCKPLNTD